MYINKFIIYVVRHSWKNENKQKYIYNSILNNKQTHEQTKTKQNKQTNLSWAPIGLK